ncbi:MAG: reverse transcriptase domain-containing protein, partial [Cyanobacteria bacterium J06626_18]
MGSFDKIAHGPLVDQLAQSHPSIARQCKAWLKAGVVNNDQIQATHEGVPQGGVISPLLANIALHGLEALVKTTIKGA